MSNLKISYLLKAKQKFEETFSNIKVQISADNNSLIVQSLENNINLIKNYRVTKLNTEHFDWVVNFNLCLIAERNKKIDVVDICDENRSFNQRCASCSQVNPYGDLMCTNCYDKIEIHYDQTSNKYQKDKIKR